MYEVRWPQRASRLHATADTSADTRFLSIKTRLTCNGYDAYPPRLGAR